MKARTKTNSIRLIAGKWRGRRLPVLDHDGLRPTTDRVRETLFNWLMHELPGARCLDAFSGSGALGLECLSRGAEYVSFIEEDKKVAAQLQSNLSLLDASKSAELISQSAIHVLRRRPAKAYDLVFLDPPFGSALLAQVIPLLVENRWLSDDALVYIEQISKQDPQPVPDAWQVYKQGKAGYCRYMLYSV